MMTILSSTIFLGGILAAAWSDVRSRRIANELVLGMLVIGVAAHGPHAAALGLSLLGALVGLALLLPAFAVRWVGGADVKLLAACGAWLGPWGILVGGLTGIALGGALALAMAVAGGVSREVRGNLVTALVTRTSPTAPHRARALVVPLAVPLAIGCALVKLGVLS
jgi:prepilin peptidase CpaA